MRALFGDWLPGGLTLLLGAAGAPAFPWLCSAVCTRHVCTFSCQTHQAWSSSGSRSIGPRAVFHVALATGVIPRSRTSESKGALTSRAKPASFPTEHFRVSGPVLSCKVGGGSRNHSTIQRYLSPRLARGVWEGQAALRGIKGGGLAESVEGGQRCPPVRDSC